MYVVVSRANARKVHLFDTFVQASNFMREQAESDIENVVDANSANVSDDNDCIDEVCIAGANFAYEYFIPNPENVVDHREACMESILANVIDVFTEGCELSFAAEALDSAGVSPELAEKLGFGYIFDAKED